MTSTLDSVESAAAAAKAAREAYHDALAVLRAAIIAADRAGERRNEIASAAVEGLSRAKVLEHLASNDVHTATQDALRGSGLTGDLPGLEVKVYEQPGGTLNLEIAAADETSEATRLELAGRIAAALRGAGLGLETGGHDAVWDVARGKAAKVGKAAAPRRNDSYGPVQLARYLGLQDWQIGRAVERGLLPGPDLASGRWSEETARTLPDLAAQVVSVLGDHPGLGSEKAAERLAQSLGLEVERADVQELAESGALRAVGEFRGWPLYAIDDLEALPRDQVAAVITRRTDWIAASVTPREAAEFLGWPVGKLEAAAQRHGVTTGRFDRYARTDIVGLAQG